MSYPILEHDPDRHALIEPARIIAESDDIPEHCVICFFKDVVDKVATEQQAKQVAQVQWEDGPHVVYRIDHQGQEMAFFHPGVGAPLASGLLEQAIAYGCRKFIACGGCGTLKQGIALGQLIVVSAAVRDEGVSYHYLPPAREVTADPKAVAAIVTTLESQRIPHIAGKTWTTDAPYRETPRKIKTRQEEGCIAVEMEAAGLMAVSRFRDVPYGQILYSGDDLSGEDWDPRDWQDASAIRERLFWLAADAVLEI